MCAFTAFLTQCGNYKPIIGIMWLRGRVRNDYMRQWDSRYARQISDTGRQNSLTQVDLKQVFLYKKNNTVYARHFSFPPPPRFNVEIKTMCNEGVTYLLCHFNNQHWNRGRRGCVWAHIVTKTYFLSVMSNNASCVNNFVGPCLKWKVWRGVNTVSVRLYSAFICRFYDFSEGKMCLS